MPVPGAGVPPPVVPPAGGAPGAAPLLPLQKVPVPKVADPSAGLGLGGLGGSSDKELASQLLALRASLQYLKIVQKEDKSGSKERRKGSRGRKKPRSRSADNRNTNNNEIKNVMIINSNHK